MSPPRPMSGGVFTDASGTCREYLSWLKNVKGFLEA